MDAMVYNWKVFWREKGFLTSIQGFIIRRFSVKDFFMYSCGFIILPFLEKGF